MLFRLSLTLSDSTLRQDGVHPLVLQVPGEPPIRVTLTDADDGRHTDCLVEVEVDPPRKAREAFESLERHELPSGHVPRVQWSRDYDFIDEHGVIAENHIAPMVLMPQVLQELAARLSGAMYDAARRAVGVFRWRAGVLGPANPFATRGVEWSLDDSSWHRMPSTGSVRLHEAWHLEVTGEAATQMQALLDEDHREPLAHELFREAWGQQWNNRRSSFLLAMVGLEVGIKEYISACVPEAGGSQKMRQARPS